MPHSAGASARRVTRPGDAAGDAANRPGDGQGAHPPTNSHTLRDVAIETCVLSASGRTVLVVREGMRPVVVAAWR